MDLVLYIGAACILLILIVFAVKVRGRTEEAADLEDHQNVMARVAARPQVAEERAAGMPRRRRNLQSRISAQQRAQRDPSDNEDSPVEPDENQEDRQASEERPQAAGKVGAKKQRKLEEKQARRSQREAELEEREERKRMQELREQERQKEDEKERLQEQKQEEELQRAKEEQERREEEEYQRLKESFVIEEQGEAEELTENESRSLLQEFIQYVKTSKVVLLEDLASHFSMRTQDAIARLQDLIADGSLTGVIDDRGKFIFITPEELNAVAQFIKQRGRISISELAQASNTLINLTPEIQSNA
ncbi:DDRGK domain-containing protein 1 isoform X1 [Xyrauchen texanus]|uniref:DDRGK domain-containing protein 1 isoform X1 n=1 Tax=Xyrauchen texanus TaxID=154827 RepID=UPI002241AE8C|nr:DDRGK domain-containing protein 1 isoform X1 [Xyrauchen texanus]